ncbi:hypothetical protein HGRIS_002197 [Hohenbuehelia grisea]|uniref:Uncharacterized protein n=1 Tax=Hohenbuehelia grisea TaxID=104357 RepID=A0ABR3JJR6_9AGAR
MQLSPPMSSGSSHSSCSSSTPSSSAPTTPTLAYDVDMDSTPLAKQTSKTPSARQRVFALHGSPAFSHRRVALEEQILAASASTATLPITSSPSSVYSSPYSSSTPELRLPPVDPRRSRRLCKDFDAGVHSDAAIDELDATLPALSALTCVFTPDPAALSVESIPNTIFDDDCSSETSSLYNDMDFDFPQPPPISPTLRRMHSTPSLAAAESVFELRELLQQRYYSPSKSDLEEPMPGYLAPPLPSFRKLRPAPGQGQLGDPFLGVAASSSSVNILPHDMAPLRAPKSDIDDDCPRSSFEISECCSERPSTTASSFSHVSHVTQTPEDQSPKKPKANRRHAMSFASIPDSFPSLHRARLATRKSLSQFKQPSSFSRPTSSSAESHRTAWAAPSLSTPRMPQIIRKVASMRSPGRLSKTPRPHTSPSAPARPPSTPDMACQAAAALGRLEMSMAKLKTYDSTTSVDTPQRRMSSTFSVKSSPPNMRVSPGRHRVTQSHSYMHQQKLSAPQMPRSFSDYSARLSRHQEYDSEYETTRSSSGSSRFLAPPFVPRPKHDRTSTIRGFLGQSRPPTAPQELKSFMDITPEREEGRSVPKERVKRLWARASHVVSWNKTQSQK